MTVIHTAQRLVLALGGKLSPGWPAPSAASLLRTRLAIPKREEAQGWCDPHERTDCEKTQCRSKNRFAQEIRPAIRLWQNDCIGDQVLVNTTCSRHFVAPRLPAMWARPHWRCLYRVLHERRQRNRDCMIHGLTSAARDPFPGRQIRRRSSHPHSGSTTSPALAGLLH